jgi:hypothetical protein
MLYPPTRAALARARAQALEGEGRPPQRSVGERGGVSVSLCISPPPGLRRRPTSPLQGEVKEAASLPMQRVLTPGSTEIAAGCPT